MLHRPAFHRAVAMVLLGAGLLVPGRAAAVAIAVGTNGISLTSTTAGASWGTPVLIDANVSFAGVWMRSDLNGIAVGNGNSIYRTVNGGSTWSPVSSPITSSYNDVMFPTAATGYIAASNGQVLKTTDGGTSWVAQSPGVAGGFFGLHFVNANQGVAVGANGAIARTTNGGTSWLDETTGTAALNDVFLFDTSNGWAVGAGGTILRTTNGGDSWSAVTSGTTVDLTAVWFTSATLGFVCGGDRVLRRTTNGGTSWSAVTLPTTQQQSGLFDLMFADPDTGIVVGSGVSAYRTIDGGTTWTVTNPDPTANEILQAVHVGRPPGPPPLVAVSVSALPAGRSFRVDGQTFTSPQTFQWESGSSHQLEAITPQSISAGERYVFQSWSGGSSSTSTSLTVSPTTAATFTANYRRQFLLTMSTVGSGTVEPGTTWQNAAATVGLESNPGVGYDLARWVGTGSGSYSGTAAGPAIAMNAPISQRAEFEAGPITLTFRTSPSGHDVVVDGLTRTTPYVLQTTADVAHTLSAPISQAEANGSRQAFDTWSDGGARTHTIDPVVSTTYTATLKTQHFLDFTVNPVNAGSVLPGDSWHDAGAIVTLTPKPVVGFTCYAMVGSGNGSFSGFSSDNARVTMNGPIGETAAFSDLTMRTITVAASPPGPDLSVAQIPIGSRKTFLWPNAQSLPLSAPATQIALANVKRWEWTGWSQGGARTQTVKPAANATYTARFDVQFELGMEAETGGTTNPAPGLSWVDSNTVVTIAALPDADHSFQSWNGSGSSAYSGSNNPAQFTMRGRVHEHALFQLLPRLTLDPTIAGRQFIAGEPETIRWTANFASTTSYPVEMKPLSASTWTPIGSATPQTGLIVWTPPDAPQSNLMLRIVRPATFTPGDTLNGMFRICDPYLKPGPAISTLGSTAVPLDVVPLDYDGDGILDLAVATAQGISLRLGQAGQSPGVGNGTFGPVSPIAIPGGTGRIAPIDFDQDGDLDLLATSRSQDNVMFHFLRQGTAGARGPLSVSSALTSSGPYADLAVGDITEDGITDFIGLHAETATLTAWRGDLDGSIPFQFHGSFATVPEPRRFRLADLNHDGLLDILVIASFRLAVHFGQNGPTPGTGTFGEAISMALPEDPGDFVLGDFVQDGRLDVAWSAPVDQRIFLVPRLGAAGPGGLLSAPMDTVASDGFYTRLAVADFDRDGHADIVAVDGIADVTKILRGNGDGTFEFLSQRAAGTAASHATVQDFLEDGRADLLLTDADGVMALHVGDLSACVQTTGSVFLEEPNAAGLSFVIGQEMTIGWGLIGTGVIGADLDISRDDGATWQPIARGIVQRRFSWTVTGPASTSCRIRARSSTVNVAGDVSTNDFYIMRLTVDVPDAPSLPAVASFAAPWPNPGRGTVHFRIGLPVDAAPRVALYDVAGRRVRLIHEGALPAGEHRLAWDGRDDAGREVATGVYFARATWEGFAERRRVVRVE